MREPTKRIKRLLREQAAVAHEEELRRALAPIASAFDRWERGELSSVELTELIHEFHQGSAREIFCRYDRRMVEAAVARAIATGVLDKSKAPQELLDHLAGLIEFYESDADSS